MKYIIKSIANLLCLLSFVAVIYPMLCLLMPLVQYSFTGIMPDNNFPLHATRAALCCISGMVNSIITNSIEDYIGYYYKRKYGSFFYWVNSL